MAEDDEEHFSTNAPQKRVFGIVFSTAIRRRVQTPDLLASTSQSRWHREENRMPIILNVPRQF